jgi:hypothetical protein
VPFSWAVAGAAAAIIMAVELDPGDKPSVERKEIFWAAAAALGVFVVAAFVKDAEEADDKWLGSRFKKKKALVIRSSRATAKGSGRRAVDPHARTVWPSVSWNVRRGHLLELRGPSLLLGPELLALRPSA